MRLNLISGQQCVWDFFLCLQENILSWPDVCSPFSFKLTHSTICYSCNHVNRSNNSSLNDQIEEDFNTSSLVGKFCEDGCQNFVQTEKSSRLTLASETEFLILILTRAMETLDGFKLVKNKIATTNDVFLR